MPQPFDRLTKLLAFHENAAAALRITIALVQAPTGLGRPRKSSGDNPMEAALALDAARRARNGANGHHAKVGRPKGSGRKVTGGFVARMLKTRRVSAKLLKGFDVTEPRAAADVLGKDRARFVGGWARGGYLKKKGDGYVRTAKPFEPELYSKKLTAAKAAE